MHAVEVANVHVVHTILVRGATLTENQTNNLGPCSANLVMHDTFLEMRPAVA